MVVASLGNRRMLLTGDARGDFILDELRALDLLRNDTIHVDLLKVPHHGSERNVREDFFRQVTADHYVISADGRHGNPDVRMLQMLTRARGDAEVTRSTSRTGWRRPRSSSRRTVRRAGATKWSTVRTTPRRWPSHSAAEACPVHRLHRAGPREHAAAKLIRKRHVLDQKLEHRASKLPARSVPGTGGATKRSSPITLFKT